MSLQTWFAFVAASAILLVIPGPTVMLVIGHALAHGARRSIWSVIGVALGDATALGCSLLGLGAFLQTSAQLFTVLKWAGALYLIWMGLRMMRPSPSGAARKPSGTLDDMGVTGDAGMSGNTGSPDSLGASGPAPARRLLAQAYVVTALNPKSILFFVAFVPQFMTPGPDVHAQMLVILATFVSLASVNAMAYALLAGSARRAARSGSVGRALSRLGGAVLVAAGIWTAAREAS